MPSSEPSAPVPLVASLEEARAGALAFGPALAASPALAGRLAYHRAWVAVKGERGWAYAPARWAGHRVGEGGLDAERYVALGDALDGRRADAAQSPWFAPVGDPRRHDKHMRRLRGLFAAAGQGQTPNARTRVLEVSVVEGGKGDGGTDALVELLVAVYRALPTPAQAAFRKRIG